MGTESISSVGTPVYDSSTGSSTSTASDVVAVANQTAESVNTVMDSITALNAQTAATAAAAEQTRQFNVTSARAQRAEDAKKQPAKDLSMAAAQGRLSTYIDTAGALENRRAEKKKTKRRAKANQAFLRGLAAGAGTFRVPSTPQQSFIPQSQGLPPVPPVAS